MDEKLTPIALISQVGLTMAGSIVVGILVGLWLDHRFGTTPLFILLLSLIGVSVGSIAVYRLISQSITAAAEGTPQRTTPSERAAPSADHSAEPTEQDESAGESAPSSSDDATDSTKRSIDREKS